MHGRNLRPFRAPLASVLLLAGAALLAVSSARANPIVPPNFAVDDAAPGAGFVVPTGMAFLPDGRFFVIEKRGQVWEVRGGIKQPTPIWNGQNEVLDQHDRGLLGVAVDPNYFQNHFIYLLYTVDPDSNGTDTNDDAFGRLTRYTVNFTDSASVIASSRTILMGYNWRNGPVSASPSHSVGALRWGRDGSLMVSVGDGAQYDFADGGGGQATDVGAFGATKTDPYEDIGAFRSQDITSLCGKILRINPANGHGYASNPFANTNLASVQSRVYAYGVRNPFRFGMRPGTGSTDTTLGNPGVIYVGDVGWNSFEEMDIARVGAKNFGWPCYEGLGGNGPYQSLNPAHNGCGSFGTSTNPSLPTSPTTSWSHGIPEQSDPAGFTGNCSIGGQFYTATSYPSQYRNQYFFADYGQNWIKVCVLDANDNRLQLIDFASSADGPVDLAMHPVTGDLYYVSILTGQVRRFRYTGATGGNTPPVAAINATPTLGAAPLQVAFTANGSFDPDGDPITYSWLFGDGTSGTGLNVNHTYNSFGLMTAQLTVSDNKGGQGVASQTITVNPPGTGFPTTGVRDNFNRADGPVGTPWVDATSGLVTSANVLTQTAASNSAVWNGGSFGRNQEAYFTFANATNAAEQNLMLKVQGTSWSTGHIEVHYNATLGRVYVNTYAPGGQGWVGRGSLAGTFANGDQLGARADSLGNVGIFKNGTSLGQINVGNWPYIGNGGSIGLTLTGLASTGGSIDNFGGGTVVTSTNSKPVALITSPTNNSFYYAGQTIDLVGTASDAETPSNQLTYQWTVDLYHNNHIHPSVYTFNGPTASFLGENHDDGTGVHMLVKFVATDPQGFHSDTTFATIWPEVDLQPGAVTVTPPSPAATEPAAISFYIRNPKRMPAPISHWMLRAGNALIAQGDVIVPALDSVQVSLNAPFPSAGTFPLRLTADSLNTVFETLETNNAITSSITVTPVPGNNVPTASAAGVPTSGTAPLDVAFSGAGSSDPDGDPLTYAWTFGDGGSGTGASVNHTYTTPGNYTATLTVDDGRGGSGTAHVDITVNAPVNTFPQTVVLDNFNRANGSLGGSWVDGVSGLTINNNRMTQTSADNSVVWNGATFGASQEEYITFSSINNLAPEQNLMLKVQGTTWSSGHIEVAYNGPQARITVNTYAPTQGWVGRGQIPGIVFQNGDRFGARTDASGNIEVYRNTTKLATLSAGNWPFVANGGRLGLTLSGSSGGFFDDFGGGTVTGAPPQLADLRVSPVVVTPDPATAAQTAQYAFKLYNRGTANAATSRWVLRANNTLLGQGDVALNAGDSTSLTVNAALGSAGAYTVRLTADSLGAVNESDETNNASVRSLTVNPGPVADLRVSPVTVTPDPAIVAQTAQYDFKVYNRGTANAPTSRWVLRANATLLGQGDVAIAAGDSAVLSVNAALGTTGTFTVRLTADSLGAVTESDETNNASVRSLTVSPGPLPDLRVSPVTVTPDPAIITQAAQYDFKVYNRGTASASTSHWVLRANATLLGQGDVAIAAGDSAVLSVNATLGTIGTFTVRLTADSLGAVSESDETNNASVRSLTVSPVPGNNPPVAVAGGTPGSGQAPLTVDFTGAGSSDADSDPLAYSWTFGDGGSGTGLTTSHAYTTAGTYAAILTVTDGRGGSDTASVSITVTPAPVTFPLTAVLDNFNRANGGVGAPWTPTTGLTVSSNQLKTTTNNISSVWNGATFGPNQEAYIRLNVITANSPEHNLMLKVQGTSWNTGHIEVRYDHSKNRISVSTYDPAVGWVQRGTNLSITLAAGDQLGARALSDGTITVFRNGVPIQTVTATGWAFNGNGGRVGLTLTRTTSSFLDDFGGGNVAGPAPIAAMQPDRAESRAFAPGVLALSSAFPNPARADVNFTLDLPRAAGVDFAVFDIQGREVWTAPSRSYEAGRWSLHWNGLTDRGPASAGVYLARVRIDGQQLLRRLAIVR